MESNKTKANRRNIILMFAVAAALIIGIALRYDYIKKEVQLSLKQYTNK